MMDNRSRCRPTDSTFNCCPSCTCFRLRKSLAFAQTLSRSCFRLRNCGADSTNSRPGQRLGLIPRNALSPSRCRCSVHSPFRSSGHVSINLLLFVPVWASQPGCWRKKVLQPKYTLARPNVRKFSPRHESLFATGCSIDAAGTARGRSDLACIAPEHLISSACCNSHLTRNRVQN